MRIRSQQRHMIDFLFPIALFFVFAISSILVILMATNVYQSTVKASNISDSSRMSLSYVAEKVHQNDQENSVSLGKFDGRRALVTEQNYGGENYRTYIYAHDGQLKELYIKDGIKASAGAGTAIMEVEDFNISEIDAGLFRISCKDKNGHVSSTVIGTRSK